MFDSIIQAFYAKAILISQTTWKWVNWNTKFFLCSFFSYSFLGFQWRRNPLNGNQLERIIMRRFMFISLTGKEQKFY